MDVGVFFRLSFITLWALLAIVRFYYGRKTKTHDSAAGVIEKLKTTEEVGIGFKIITLIISVFGVLGLVLYLLSQSWWKWTIIPISGWVQWLGIVVSIGLIFFLIWVHQYIDKQWSITLEVQEDHKLITTGPYKYVRHPMYLGLFLYTIGLMMISLDVFVVLFLHLRFG